VTCLEFRVEGAWGFRISGVGFRVRFEASSPPPP
jgi:hypothetical protein